MFITEAYAQAAGAGAQSMTSTLFLIGGMLVFFYFFMIRPQQKRQKEHRNMIASIAKGDEVVIAGGIYGKISKLGDTQFGIEIADGVEIAVRRDAVLNVLPKGTIK